MNTLRDAVSQCFGQGTPPSCADLVISDGFDPFEKEDALAFYGGKTWQDVFAYLQGIKGNPAYGAAYFLEEWAVLNPVYLAYYLRAHLENVLENLASVAPDTEFVLHLLDELRHISRPHKASPFTPAQTALLKRLAQYVRDCAAKDNMSVYQERDIEERATQLLADLDAYGS